jgi:hypothetical protein
MKEVRDNIILILLSHIAKKIFQLIFFLIGVIVSSCRWELKTYLKEIAIVNDVYLNVVGQHSLNGVLSTNGTGFGSRLQTVSAAMGWIKLTKFGKYCSKLLSKKDKDHCEKALAFHKENIIKEYNKFI